jgi:hypothetical protein
VLLGGPIPHDGPVEGIAVRPDAGELAVGSGDSVMLWDIRPEAWALAACRLAGRELTEAEWRNHVGGAGATPTCP